MPKFNKSKSNKGPSQRQLKVGEEIRHALSEVFLRGELHASGLADTSITVSEVRISPDLKNATAYVLPLAGENKEGVVTALNDNASALRKMVSNKVYLKFSPRITFRLDESFEQASRINELLQKPHVAQDLNADADDA
jgi:ribosome-binding factor A